MDKARLAIMDPKQIGQLAVAYFATRIEEAPEDVRPFLRKISQYGATGMRCQKVINDAERAIDEMGSLMQKTIGSIDAVTDIIVDQLDPKVAMEAAEKYEIPENRAQQAPQGAQEKTPDMAGATAKDLKPPEVKAN